ETNSSTNFRTSPLAKLNAEATTSQRWLKASASLATAACTSPAAGVNKSLNTADSATIPAQNARIGIISSSQPVRITLNEISQPLLMALSSGVTTSSTGII